MNELIFLIGYRGSGKSTVGALLADKLGWSFVDADALLEERAERTIREIFASEGEASFRNRESAILAELAGSRHTVIATGGGVVLRPENRLCLRRGWTVWLQTDARELWQRIQSDATTASRRPDLAQGGLSEIEALLALREPMYRECANLTVASKSPELAADAILAAWTSLMLKSSGPPASS